MPIGWIKLYERLRRPTWLIRSPVGTGPLITPDGTTARERARVRPSLATIMDTASIFLNRSCRGDEARRSLPPRPKPARLCQHQPSPHETRSQSTFPTQALAITNSSLDPLRLGQNQKHSSLQKNTLRSEPRQQRSTSVSACNNSFYPELTSINSGSHPAEFHSKTPVIPPIPPNLTITIRQANVSYCAPSIGRLRMPIPPNSTSLLLFPSSTDFRSNGRKTPAISHISPNFLCLYAGCLKGDRLSLPLLIWEPVGRIDSTPNKE